MGAATKPFRSSPRTAAVLWDMDGTIVDTEPYWIATEYELVAEFGGEWSEEKAHSIVGKDLRDSAAVLRDRGGVDLPIDDIVNRLLDGVIEKLRMKVPWRPGTVPWLRGIISYQAPARARARSAYSGTSMLETRSRRASLDDTASRSAGSINTAMSLLESKARLARSTSSWAATLRGCTSSRNCRPSRASSAMSTPALIFSATP